MDPAPYEIKKRDGLTWAEAGAEHDGLPVIFLHGMMGDISNWETTIPAVAKAGYRVLCPILPVYTMPLRAANLDGLVTFVDEFLDSQGLHEVVLAGNSLGGHLAVLFAIKHPEHVRALVLTGASGIYEVEMSSSIMRRKDKNYLRPRVEKTFYDPSHVTEELLDDIIEIINNREKAVRLIKFARSVDKASVKTDLDRVHAPTLLVWGSQDLITPPHVARTFYEGIPHSELHFLDECGHVPMQEQPGKFNELLIEFLNKTRSVDSTVLAS